MGSCQATAIEDPTRMPCDNACSAISSVSPSIPFLGTLLNCPYRALLRKEHIKMVAIEQGHLVDQRCPLLGNLSFPRLTAGKYGVFDFGVPVITGEGRGQHPIVAHPLGCADRISLTGDCLHSLYT